jgi:hypothetical protein
MGVPPALRRGVKENNTKVTYPGQWFEGLSSEICRAAMIYQLGAIYYRPDDVRHLPVTT